MQEFGDDDSHTHTKQPCENPRRRRCDVVLRLRGLGRFVWAVLVLARRFGDLLHVLETLFALVRVTCVGGYDAASVVLLHCLVPIAVTVDGDVHRRRTGRCRG